MAYKHPPKGYVINDGDYGTIFIGEDKETVRKRQIEIHSASDAAVKLFQDGGFEIQSQSTSKLADNIVSRSQEGLAIKGKNIRLSADGEITISARAIRFESTGSDTPFIIRSGQNMELYANNTIKVDGSVVGIGARTRMLFRSPGPIRMFTDAGFSCVEPTASLVPQNLLNSVIISALNMFNY